ncbi:MAG: DUF4080 domain-containing protein [Granulosicoccus sp.]
MNGIILSTINARYIHASLGLRYLYANMAELQPQCTVKEFTLDQRPEDIAEALLKTHPHIIGFGVYIWNVEQTTEVMRLIRVIQPKTILVAGGPEVSHEMDKQEICALADHVVTGMADQSFAGLCEDILAERAPSKHVCSLPVQLDALESPYPHYSDEDLRNRVLYVEASRGCPFKCEFCLSSLDKTAVAFPLPAFLEHMQSLIDRGARQFKFVDRTFNLKAQTSREILQFFLEHIDKGLFLHFELIPDRLPDTLLELLPLFPANSLQFEIGIQSFNPDVQKRISRRQQHERTCHNLRWLRQNTHAHIHADLIFGLPGETLESFGDGFDLLYELQPQEIQVGLLKRLRGTPITRHTEAYDMRYMSSPPYRVLSTAHASFETVQRMVRFSRYWDLVGNSGRFPNTLPLLLDEQPFSHFLSFSDWLFNTSGQTHRIGLPRLFDLVYRYLVEARQLGTDAACQSLLLDYAHNKLKGQPGFVRDTTSTSRPTGIARRQRRHLA